MIIDIVKKIKSVAEKEIENRKNIISQIEIIYDDIINENLELNFIKVDSKNTEDHVACGIDGGKYEAELEDITFVFAKAALVVGKFHSKKSIPKSIKEDFRILENYYGKSNVMNTSILFMLHLETKMIEACEECDVIFIDGPIIEPPYYEGNYIKLGDFFDVDELIKYRSKIIGKFKNKFMIGIVKNFYHRFVINYLVSEGYRKLQNARESYLVYNLFMRYRKENKYEGALALGNINWDSIFKKENVDDLKFLSNVYSRYKKENKDIEMSSVYFQIDSISPIARVDFESSKDVMKVLSLVTAWGVGGIKEVVILNKLADEYSSITQKDVMNYIELFKIFYNKNFNDEFIVKLMKKD